MSGLRTRATFNLALLAVAGGLIAFIWLGPPAQPGPEAPRLGRLDPITIASVRIERTGHPPLALERHGVRWRIVAPFQRPADAAKVTALLGLASARIHEAFRAAGNDLAAFGLDPPVARVWFDDEEFTFGDTDALNGWRYVLHGHDVHLITDAYFHHILATPSAFLDPAPLADVPRPTAILVAPPAQRAYAQKAGELASENRNDHDSPGNLIDAWVAARAIAVRPLNSTFEWTNAVHMSLPAGKPDIHFQVALVGNQLLFARPDWAVQYHFPRAAGERLLGGT